MPGVVQVITHLIAARYFVTILQTVFLAGNIWSVILPNALALLVHVRCIPRAEQAEVSQETGIGGLEWEDGSLPS